MLNKNEKEKTDNKEKEENSEENKDTISKLLENEQDFIIIIKKIIDFEFDDLFPKILNLPKIDFLNQLTSNVTYIMAERFSNTILENEKCLSLITSTCHSFDKKYNKYLEELSQGWDKYNLHKMNNILDNSETINNNQQIINNDNNSFFFTNFRKHCIYTQNIAIHQCNKGGEIGNFISIYINNNNNNSSSESSNNKPRIKYLICENCRKSYYIYEFPNFCQYCNMTYLSSSLYKNENANFLSATFNPPHCETFVNEEIPCSKCKNILYIDTENNLLKCGDKNCNYCLDLNQCKNKINFKCKICKNYFISNVKIYNPIEVFHFKDIIKKALLYKRKAFPGKLSCCNDIKEKHTDFYHKKDCKGNLYLAEYNHKMIIVCSKCKAVNQYSKFIWTCPECGLHFRDKKSEINEIKIRKTKSSNRMVNNIINDIDKDNYSTINNLYSKRSSLADILKHRKKKENNKPNMDNIGFATGYDFFNSKNKLDNFNTNNPLSERNLNIKDDALKYDYYDNNEMKISSKKIKRGYLLGKILPWGTPKNYEKENDSAKSKKIEYETSDNKKYYDKKVDDLINPKKENYNNNINLYHSDKAFFRRVITTNDDKYNEKNNKNDYKISEFKLNEYFDLDKSEKEIKKLETIEVGEGFKKKKLGEVKNLLKDVDKEQKEISSDIKNKKYSPIKIKYVYNNNESKQEKNIIQKKESKEENDTLKNSNKNNNFIYISKYNNNKKEEKNTKNIDTISISTNNKESWQSKETTAKGSIESKNSLLSHSPSKDDLDKNNKIPENKPDNKILEEDITPYDLIDYENCIIIEDKTIKENETMYRQLQRKLKRIISRGKLPRFDLDKFTIEKQIGDGSFGVIYSIYNNKTKKRYAMKKIIANDIDSLELYQKEFELAHHEKHSSILDIKGTYIKCFDNTTFVLYVLMDLAEKDWEVEINERQKWKRYYKEDELIIILKQLSNALFLLQKKSIAHRDIKPENILLFKNPENNNDIIYKICDFGEAKDYAYIRSKKQKTLRGTELYMSPLLYDGLLHDDSYVEHDAYKSDVFSLGCCMIIAMNLNFDIIIEIRKIKEQNEIKDFLKKKLNGRYSDKLLDIVMKMINFNERERIDFLQLENLIEKNF